MPYTTAAMKRKKSSAFLNLSHARTGAQRTQMEEIIKEGICPFCEEHLRRTHAAPVEWRGKYWSITKNDYPYEGTTHHYLAITREHLTDIRELSDASSAELMRHFKKIAKLKKIKGGTVVMRFGDTNRTTATIEHLHAHIIAGGRESKAADKIKVSVGYKKK